MTDLVVQELNVIARAGSHTGLPSIPSGRGVDVAAEDRKVTYFKLKELLTGWARVYDDHIRHAIWDWNDTEGVERQLIEVVQSFDEAMIDLASVNKEQQKVIARLEDLMAAVRQQPDPRLSDRRRQKFVAKRRKRIRSKASAVMRAITEMQQKVATPGWLERNFRRLWGEVRFVIEAGDEERFKIIASNSLGALSRAAAKKLELKKEVIEAFATLNLGVWANESEMLERHRYLIKRYHPDSGSGDNQMASRLNAARDTLLAHYAPNHKFERSQETG